MDNTEFIFNDAANQTIEEQISQLMEDAEAEHRVITPAPPDQDSHEIDEDEAALDTLIAQSMTTPIDKTI